MLIQTHKIKKWYVLYTKPKWEKKVDGVLLKKEIESWCPLQKIQKQWSDRKKIIEEPLFRSYVFVRINEDERIKVLQTEGVINFVHYLHKPAIIREEEIGVIKSYLLEKDAKLSVQSQQSFQMNDKIIVRQGIFMDNTGTVIRSGSKKIYVQLESLGQIMIVEFPVNYVSSLFNGL